MGRGNRRGGQLGIIQAGVDEGLDLQDEGLSPGFRPDGRLAPELLAEGRGEQVEHRVGELESRHDLVVAELVGQLHQERGNQAADTAAARDAAGYDVGQVVRSHVQQLAGEHDDEHPELAVEAELIGAARVVEREIAWRQRCLAAILRDQAVATELDAEFEVARIESPDGLSGAIDVDGAACDIAELHGTDGAVAQDPAEWTFGPAPCVERYEGLGHCFVPRVELFGWRQRAKRRDGVHRITSAVRSVTVNILAAQHVAPWHRYDDLPERAVGVASSAGHTVASAS